MVTFSLQDTDILIKTQIPHNRARLLHLIHGEHHQDRKDLKWQSAAINDGKGKDCVYKF
jgi:hypothetical protein